MRCGWSWAPCSGRSPARTSARWPRSAATVGGHRPRTADFRSMGAIIVCAEGRAQAHATAGEALTAARALRAARPGARIAIEAGGPAGARRRAGALAAAAAPGSTLVSAAAAGLLGGAPLEDLG